MVVSLRKRERFVTPIEQGEFHGEGLITFFDGDEALFKFYRPAGIFPAQLSGISTDLTES